MSVMMWTYAAIGLLIVLTVLLVAPYFGVYGSTEPFDEPMQEEAQTLDETTREGERT